MKRLVIRHCRDKAVKAGYRWDLWCRDTMDPFAEPLYVGYGSYRDCHGVMLNLLMTFNQEVPKFQIGGFHSPWPKSAIKS